MMNTDSSLTIENNDTDKDIYIWKAESFLNEPDASLDA